MNQRDRALTLARIAGYHNCPRIAAEALATVEAEGARRG